MWIAAALLAAGVVVSAFLERHAEQGLQQRLAIHLDALVAASETEDGTTGLTLAPELTDPRFERPFSGWYWQVGDGGDPVLRSRSLWDQALAIDPPAAAGHAAWLRLEGPEGQRLRALVRDLTLPDDDRLFRYAVAAEEGVITAEIRPVQRTLTWMLAGLGGGLLIALFIQVRFGLRPLWRMRRALGEVRAGRAERLDADYVKELAPIAAELNALIDHNAAILERARRHLGDLAHGLKTPLSVLRNEASLHGEVAAGLVAQQVGLMTRMVDRHLARARSAGAGRILGARTPVAPVVDTLRRTLLRIHADKPLDFQCSITADAVFAGEREDLEEMLGNLMDNAAKWARARVRVAVAQSDRGLAVTIDDDGPGLPADRRRDALARGTRLDESAPGSGLGLAIVVDLAKLYGGRLTLGDAPEGGLRVALTLPAA
ncbi:MAG: hypothetical protein EA406_02010 [Rhodospirillales bacterium]|nr:MAG: hypothetical protein EA406_02010 [Rhodospirillales bacterium]